MKNVFRLFAYEFKNIWKQALIFAFISTFLFALSISVMCFSTDMVQGYKDWADDNDYYSSVEVYNVENFDSYKKFQNLGGGFFARMHGITQFEEEDDDEYKASFRPMLVNGSGEKVGGAWGLAYIFEEEFPKEIIHFGSYLSDGEYWGAALNERNADGLYQTYLSAATAQELQVGVGDKVYLIYELTDGTNVEEILVAGIYSNKIASDNSYIYDFVIPFSFACEHKDKLLPSNPNIRFHPRTFSIELEKPSDIMEMLPKVRRLNAGDTADYEDIILVNTMRYILITVAVAIVIVTFVVLSNSLTITINSRKKFMAKLKLLGATTNKVTAAYFILLIASFIVAFALSILLSYLLCGYFTSIASVALEYKVTMKLHWDAVGILLGAGCVLLAIRYLLFRLKVKKVAPVEFIKED